MTADEGIRAWYSRAEVKFELAKSSAWRELCAIGAKATIRPFKAYRVSDWDFWLQRIAPWASPFDIYQSVATLNLPPLPNKFTEMPAARKHLHDNWDGMMRGYDFFMDIDVQDKATDYALATRKAIEATMNARDRGIAAYLVYSGTGWNVRAPDITFGSPNGWEFARNLCADICTSIELPFKTGIQAKKDGDRAWADWMVYDARRVQKVIGSLSTKSGRVVTPLTIAEAGALDPESLHYSVFDAKWKMRDRLGDVQADARRALQVDA